MRPRMTPLEVQKHEFSRRWKGLDPVEVQQFLTDVAEDMEALARENSDLDVRLRTLEQENEEHRERERILKQTLLSAQQASEDMRNAARKEGELIIREDRILGRLTPCPAAVRRVEKASDSETARQLRPSFECSTPARPRVRRNETMTGGRLIR